MIPKSHSKNLKIEFNVWPCLWLDLLDIFKDLSTSERMSMLGDYKSECLCIFLFLLAFLCTFVISKNHIQYNRLTYTRKKTIQTKLSCKKYCNFPSGYNFQQVENMNFCSVWSVCSVFIKSWFRHMTILLWQSTDKRLFQLIHRYSQHKIITIQIQ